MSRKSRNWDESPETAGDTRFHDLRASGYRGPIDQDGNATTHEAWCAQQGIDPATGVRCRD